MDIFCANQAAQKRMRYSEYVIQVQEQVNTGIVHICHVHGIDCLFVHNRYEYKIYEYLTVDSLVCWTTIILYSGVHCTCTMYLVLVLDFGMVSFGSQHTISC
jgi:hypothetical protein